MPLQNEGAAFTGDAADLERSRNVMLIFILLLNRTDAMQILWSNLALSIAKAQLAGGAACLCPIKDWNVFFDLLIRTASHKWRVQQVCVVIVPL